ncbi:ABC transporter ATP-binding protein [Lentibacillus saliphilus]|uniref:ABC transporter ATP-binding protein n=1 Tax=Lentibacillus saliphilus TaxID=2737028 RepID=UPI001C30765E
MAFLTLDHVSHHYFSEKSYTKALEDITFSVDEGEFVALLGPSGCGKSTILSIISGIISQTEGSVLLNKTPILKSTMAIGYMLQQDYLFPWKTIMDNVCMGPKIMGTKTVSTTQKAEDLLEEVGLTNISSTYPDALSGGMRQRVALVRTLMTDPKVLLLDEPFSALDYLTKLKLENLVSKLLKEYNKTALLVTHDIGEAISMSDRIIVMDANPGKIAKCFEVPIELRNEEPFWVRRHPKYHVLFEKVWNELNKDDTISSTQKEVESHNETKD